MVFTPCNVDVAVVFDAGTSVFVYDVINSRVDIARTSIGAAASGTRRFSCFEKLTE